MFGYRPIGFTEAGDAGLDFSWTEKLYDVNIIISKHLTVKNERLIEELIAHKRQVIFHCTCTGYGGTVVEPNVPTPEEVHEGVLELIRRGFPKLQIVLRTDPIIPTPKGVARVEKVWQLFSDTGIVRCRVSIIDMYPHVKARFEEAWGYAPFNTFQAPQEMQDLVRAAIRKAGNKYKFETCAEHLMPKEKETAGCVGKADFALLNVPCDNPPGGFQRAGCKCLMGKTELLQNRFRCPSGCLYCYWKDKAVKEK